MGCCQDKDCHTCNEEAKEAELEEVKEEDTDVDIDGEGTDVDSTNHRNLKSNESLLITVLWRRLSMFSRRGSTRSNKRRQSIQIQKQGRMLPENNSEGILEEPEKG
ncbi:testis-expressed protein 54-like [Pteropus alecto]|uniref:Testis expressed 54 n=1 Tax=Pteropus alecto TaxID=9402 RepID=L5KR43_PTEAL|nr:testis-expressed protein 54-like [Pteropus alecto]XP_039716175.1 testis-expressed protein 54-like [Pteropus giganteus]ELK13426.1 hypothetical protein PAL_GLEAN10011459 [Pteropus alecto]